MNMFSHNFALILQLHLPHQRARLDALYRLWLNTEPGGFLVLVEAGTSAGFLAIAEARAFLLDLKGLRWTQPSLGDDNPTQPGDAGQPSVPGGHAQLEAQTEPHTEQTHPLPQTQQTQQTFSYLTFYWWTR